MKNGKIVEIEYSKQYGPQNGIHLFFANLLSKNVYDFLANELKIAVDEIDYMGRNPFMISCTEFSARDTFLRLWRIFSQNESTLTSQTKGAELLS